MKRLLVSILACLIVLLNLAVTGTAQAESLVADSPPSTAAPVEQPAPPVNLPPVNLIEELKTQVMPQLESILTPEQRNQLETAMVEGKTSLRKAFKSIMLTPDQKNKLATIFKTLPKKEVFTSMTPEQKKKFFMKKKEMFMPTADEIAGYKAQSEKP